MNQLDLLTPEARPGFRLARFEVLNWGTFHKHVWGLDPEGNNSLLTGDIGSGKSTLVDALTALLVPRVNFNKAAGAIAGERSTETYFFGRYKAERGEPGLSSKPVSLRGPESYSVLLARFYNEALAQHVTLAQVFWAKGPQGPPSRLFVIADKPLSIREHFAAFGPDINTLRKRLRGMRNVKRPSAPVVTAPIDAVDVPRQREPALLHDEAGKAIVLRAPPRVGVVPERPVGRVPFR